MKPMVKVDNLIKRYDDFTLGTVSFEIPGNCVVGVFGPNGAGKTTLLKLLFRQLLPQSGSIEILGQTFEENEKGLKNLVASKNGDKTTMEDVFIELTGRSFEEAETEEETK